MNCTTNSDITIENVTQIVQTHENPHENIGTSAILPSVIHTNATYMVGAEPAQIQIVSAFPPQRGSSDDEATLVPSMRSNNLSNDVLFSRPQNENFIVEDVTSNTSRDPVPFFDSNTASSDGYEFLDTPVFDSLSPLNFGQPQEQASVNSRVQELDPTNGYRDINRFVYEADAIPLPSTNSFDETSNNIYIFIIANIIIWLE